MEVRLFLPSWRALLLEAWTWLVCRVVEEWEGHPFEEREIPPLLAVVVVVGIQREMLLVAVD
jgi:hypothetical protein